jgi:hypothetical protein
MCHESLDWRGKEGNAVKISGIFIIPPFNVLLLSAMNRK